MPLKGLRQDPAVRQAKRNLQREKIVNAIAIRERRIAIWKLKIEKTMVKVRKLRSKLEGLEG